MIIGFGAFAVLKPWRYHQVPSYGYFSIFPEMNNLNRHFEKNDDDNNLLGNENTTNSNE